VRLGKRLGRIGFVVGFIGPILSYSIHREVYLFCLLCPHVDLAFGYPLVWLKVGLALGLMQGLVYALLAFAIGYSISKIKPSI